MTIRELLEELDGNGLIIVDWELLEEALSELDAKFSDVIKNE